MKLRFSEIGVKPDVEEFTIDFRAMLTSLVADEEAMEKTIKETIDYIGSHGEAATIVDVLSSLSDKTWYPFSAARAAVLASSHCIFQNYGVHCEIPEISEILLNLKRMVEGTIPCTIDIVYPEDSQVLIFIDLITGVIYHTSDRSTEWILDELVELFLES